MSKILDKFKKQFFGFDRSVKLRRNILLSFVFKIISMITGFLLVPVCLNYLDKTRYGIWLTVTSFVVWLSFFEIGLGSGLRNKLAESLAVNDFKSAKIYVSTIYAIITIIMAIMASVFIIFHNKIQWVNLFNTDLSLSTELSSLISIVLFSFFITFILRLIINVLYADQRPALATGINTFSNLISLLLIIIISRTMKSSLLYLGLALSVSPLIVLLVYNVYLFRSIYKPFSPSIKFVDFRYSKELFGLGINFFIIQICGLILYQSSNFIIAHYIGLPEVTSYNIAYKLFSIINMMFLILITPYWSAFTDAWKKEDILWINKSVKLLIKIWGIMAFCGFIILLFSDKIYHFWIGDTVQISLALSSLLYLYFIIFTFSGIFNMFINGVGKIRLQLYVALFGSAIFFPLSIYFIRNLEMGIEGLVIAMIIVNLLAIVFAPIQFRKIIKKKATGIWNR